MTSSSSSVASAQRSRQQELERALETEKKFLFHIARNQLNNEQCADDVLQETALAAWQSLDRFEARSSMRTWLVSILRFKILDALRTRQHTPINLSALEVDAELLSLEGLMFDDEGCWREMPMLWESEITGPEERLQQKQAIEVLQVCLKKLPEKTAQVFLMREYLGFEGPEIANRTNLKSGHIRIILMRARLALRTCLELKLTDKSSVAMI